MKKIIIGICCFLALSSEAKAQTAIDFNMSDCYGGMHHLFPDYLDNNHVVILEFFMSCTSCTQVGQAVTPMYNQLNIDYPGQVHFFAFNFLDYTPCSDAIDFVVNGGINAVPFDSGATQLDYYYGGAFGMPNIVIVGGAQHEILHSTREFSEAMDTATMDSIIRSFFNTIGYEEEAFELGVTVYPNPINNIVNIDVPPADFKNGEITIQDLSGQLVFNKRLENKDKIKLNLEFLEPGVYIIHIKIDQFYKTVKVIKQ